jgi:hypothetical protein
VDQTSCGSRRKKLRDHKEVPGSAIANAEHNGSGIDGDHFNFVEQGASLGASQPAPKVAATNQNPRAMWP